MKQIVSYQMFVTHPCFLIGPIIILLWGRISILILLYLVLTILDKKCMHQNANVTNYPMEIPICQQYQYVNYHCYIVRDLYDIEMNLKLNCTQRQFNLIIRSGLLTLHCLILLQIFTHK